MNLVWRAILGMWDVTFFQYVRTILIHDWLSELWVSKNNTDEVLQIQNSIMMAYINWLQCLGFPSWKFHMLLMLVAWGLICQPHYSYDLVRPSKSPPFIWWDHGWPVLDVGLQNRTIWQNSKALKVANQLKMVMIDIVKCYCTTCQTDITLLKFWLMIVLLLLTGETSTRGFRFVLEHMSSSRKQNNSNRGTCLINVYLILYYICPIILVCYSVSPMNWNVNNILILPFISLRIHYKQK